MKKILLIAVLCLTSFSYAQRGDKIRAYKTAYITDQLDLSPTEAERFWPVYNKYDDQLAQIRRKERKEVFDAVNGDLDSLSEEQAQGLVESIRDLKRKEQQTHEAMLDALIDILPAKKILKLKRAEEEFKRSLLDRYKNRHGGRP